MLPAKPFISVLDLTNYNAYVNITLMIDQRPNHTETPTEALAQLQKNPQHERVSKISNPNKLRRFIAGALVGAISLVGCSAGDSSENIEPSTPTTSTVLTESSTMYFGGTKSEATPTTSEVPTLPEFEYAPIEIDIVGNAECVEDTESALHLLQATSPSSYQEVSENISIIECVTEGSGMYAYEQEPRFVVGDATREAGALWYASAIVHDATHSKLYNEYRESHPGERVPDTIWTGEDAEMTCLEAQASALDDMGAPKNTIEAVLGAIETKYWEVPIDERDW